MNLSTAALAQTSPSPRAAGYMVVEVEEVPLLQVLTGRAVSPNATQIRPRVAGEVVAILYEAGQKVEAGTPLFTLDDVTYRTALTSAEASLARAEAEVNASETAFNRVESLRNSSAASQATLDQAEADFLKAKANLAAARAELDLAKAQLNWTTIRAPIAGIVGVAAVAIGDLVTQNQAAALTDIIQVDPVNVDLSEPYPLRLRLEARARAGEISLSTPEMAFLTENGPNLPVKAQLSSASATVSPSTGTRMLRFVVDNPDGLIAPGMFVKAELTYGTQRAILVPQRATQRERDGRLSAWVAKDGKAEKRYLSESGSFGSAWVVEAGLVAGDWLLLDGLTNLREGDDITPVPVSIDAAGVVRDLAPNAATDLGN